MKQRRWVEAAMLVAMTATFIAVSSCASNAMEPASDKPIDLMTPAELFAAPGLRALAKAAQHGNVEKIDTLIARGVNVNGRGRFGETPLFSAFQVRNKRGFKALLEHGSNPNFIDDNGQTLMNDIAGYGSTYFMKLALEHGGNPNLVEPYTGKTPLIAAVSASENVNIPTLIKAGANLNYQTPIYRGGEPKYPPSGGETAMMEAFDFDVIYELLEAGADYSLKDARGKTLEDSVIFSYQEAESPSSNHWRDKVIAFLKAHHAWDALPRVKNLRASTRVTSAGETYTLSWDAVPGADHYDLFRRGSHGGAQMGVKTTSVKETEPETEDWQAVWWLVRACTKTKCGGVTQPVFIKIPSYQPGY